MKAIIYRHEQKLTETTRLVITEELYNKILEDVHCEPMIPFKEFYEHVIGNEWSSPWVKYDYLLKKGYHWHDVDYYDGESISGYVEAGMKRREGRLTEAIKEYFEWHPDMLPKPERDLENHSYTTIEVPDRKVRYE